MNQANLLSLAAISGPNYQRKVLPGVTAFIIFVHLVALLGFFTFSWPALFVCLFFHWVTGGLGITLGYHRLLTHRSFETPKWVEYFLTLCAVLALQGGPLTWVASHRLHHQHSDTNGDPHNSLRGFFWSHMGWVFYDDERLDTDEKTAKLVPDLAKDPVHWFFQKTLLLWTIGLGVIFYLIGGWPWVIWGIFVRLVLVYHSTWLVNSATHLWGYQTYKTGEYSTNLWWVALVTYGEGWHNNHHAFQYSARHGLKWWEFDSTYLMIQILQKLGLAKSVRIPSAQLLSGTHAPGVKPTQS